MLSLLGFLFLFIIITLFSIVYWYLSKPNNLPPGPIGLPFIGSYLAFFGGDNAQTVLKQYAKTYGPIYQFYVLNKLVVVLADFDTIQEALVNQGDTFAGRPAFRLAASSIFIGRGILFSEGPLWRKERHFALTTLRKLGLGRNIVENLIKAETEHLRKWLVDYATTREPFNPHAMTTFPLANIVAQLAFGKRFDYDDDVLAGHLVSFTQRVSGAGSSMISPVVFSKAVWALMKHMPKYRKIQNEQIEFDEFLETEMKEAIASFDPDVEPDNFIHAYLKAAPHAATKRESYLQLLTAVADVFIAGFETTSTTLRWAVLFLAHDPDVQEKMHEEIKEQTGLALPGYGDRFKMPYTQAVIAEIQRHADLVPLGITRRCMEPTTLLGYHIPEEAIVVPLLSNVLHNPDVFPDPHRFNPDRFLDANGKFVNTPEFIPFGAGKRICLGELLADMDLFLFLTAFVTRFRVFFPPHNPSPSLEPVAGVTCSPSPYEICIEMRGDWVKRDSIGW